MAETADERIFPATSMPALDWWHALWPDPEGSLRSLGVKDGECTVDLCSGTGHFTKPMAKIAGAGWVAAVELDRGILEKAKAHCAEYKNIRWIEGDARLLPDMLPEKADAVVIGNTFHGVPDKIALSAAVHAALRPGGRFIIINWYPLPKEQTVILGQPRGPLSSMRMAPQQVRDIVVPAGFGLGKIVEMPPYHYGAIFIKRENQ